MEGSVVMSNDRGQAMPWLLLVVVLAMGLVIASARLGVVVDESARARTAADAAALAGAAGDEAAARALAEANGGELITFVRLSTGVEVVVRVGEVSARARATATSSWERGPD